MKKVMYVFVVLILASNFLFAQGTEEKKISNQGPVELTFWSLFTGGDGEFFNAIVEGFNSSQSNFVMKNDMVKFDNYYTKLTTALAAKNAPDLVIIHQGNLLNYVSNNSLLPLNDYFDAQTLADFQEKPLASCMFDDQLYSIPLDVHPLVMYYNKDILASAGIQSVPKTGAEMALALKQIKEKTEKWGLLIDEPYELPRMFISLVAQQGGSILNEKLDAANVNNQTGERAMKYLIDLVNNGYNPKETDYDSAMNIFKLGNAAFYINGVWATGVLEEQEGLNFAASRIPRFFEQEASWAGSHTLAIPTQKTMGPKKVQGAVAFIDWATKHGELWAKAGHIPTRKSVYEKEEFKALPYRAGYADAAAFALGTPKTPAWDQIYNYITEACEYAVAKNQSPAEAVAKMDEKINEILKSY